MDGMSFPVARIDLSAFGIWKQVVASGGSKGTLMPLMLYVLYKIVAV
jgi:hypothetical protein